jgi:adenine-specific DNA-methyltransferase
MAERMAAGLIMFGKDETTIPNRKRYLEDVESMEPRMIFEQGRLSSTRHLESVLSGKRFPYPKDHNVLMRWFRMIAPSDAIILDFFGGSGTTAEAVMRLNAEDDGTRQAILVTNNELSSKDDKRLRAAGHTPGDPEYEALGVFHHVTRPRVATVVSGVREDGSKFSDGLAANVAFFDLEYLDRASVRYGHEFDALAGVFWLKAGGSGPLIKRQSLAQGFAVSVESNVAVLFRPGKAAALAEVLATTEHPYLTHVFVVTDSTEQGDVAAGYFNPALTVERIYGSYLSAFQVNKKD